MRVRRTMLCEPLLAHPSEMGAIYATRHTHSGEDDNRDRRDDSADDEQHWFAANLSRRIAILAFLGAAVCAFVHMGRARELLPQDPSRSAAGHGWIAAAHVCIPEQRCSATAAYASGMQLASLKAGLATLWISAALIAGIIGNIDSAASWTALASIAIIPPIVMMWRWNAPPQTMSESIQEARR